MIVIDGKTIGLWFMSLTPIQDWLCSLRQGDDGKIEMVYRFRHYDADDPANDPFSGKDKKKWFKVTIPSTPEKAIEAARQLVAKLEEASGNTADEILMGPGGADEFMAMYASMPWAHMKTELVEDSKGKHDASTH